MMMRHLVLTVALAAVGLTGAETFTIERNDARPFRIHGSPDETPATKAMFKELAAEVKRVTLEPVGGNAK